MRILYFRSVVPSFFLFSSPNLSGRRVRVYHTYLIAAIVMTFRVLEGHTHIARILKCNFRILARLMVPLHLQSFLYSMLCYGVGFSGSLSGDVDSSQQSQPQPVVISDVPAASTFNCIDDGVHQLCRQTSNRCTRQLTVVACVSCRC